MLCKSDKPSIIIIIIVFAAVIGTMTAIILILYRVADQ